MEGLVQEEPKKFQGFGDELHGLLGLKILSLLLLGALSNDFCN